MSKFGKSQDWNFALITEMILHFLPCKKKIEDVKIETTGILS